MADGLNEHPQTLATDDHVAGSARPAFSARRRAATHREHVPHSHKFRVAIAMLIGVALGAIVVAVIAAQGSNSKHSSLPWSAWQPPDSGTQGAWEIANHIAPLYRISAVDQLDVVTVVNLSDPSATAAASTSTSSGLQLAVRSSPGSSQISLLGGKTVAYNLCGMGTSNCAIGVGTPSPDRLLLIKREALELALYTFKYLKGVQNVVVILPPGYAIQTSALTLKPPAPKSVTNANPVYTAVLFLHDELSPWLDQPLSATFPEQFPPSVPELPAWSQTEEAGLVAQITGSGLFTEKLVQGQDGSNLMLLNPQPPQ